MSTKKEREHDECQERQEREALDVRIRQRVIHTLGRPVGLKDVQVRLLWENYYRVNVLVGVNVASAKIIHSYFVKTDANGNIIESTPKIAELS